MVTINPEIVQFIRHLALTGHLTVMYKDSTNIGVNLTKGKPLTNPRNNFIQIENLEFLNLCICMFLYITSPNRPPNLFEESVTFCHGLSR